MKQKKIGTTLYVFSEVPYEITQDTDASVICIQEECIPGYAALNESLVSKFKAYNYHLFCVQKPEWADYYDDNIVVINPMTHGSVTANPMSADPGEEITLTVTPSENYELQSLTVVDGNDNPVTVTDNKFEMPEGNAYVSATFVGMEFDITVTAATNGTVSTSPANGARLGDTVTITMTPDQGYEVDTLTVTSGAATITVTNNQFTMPAGDVTVTGTFKSSAVPFEQQYFTIESLVNNNNFTIMNEPYLSGYISLDNGNTWTRIQTNEEGEGSGLPYIEITLHQGEKAIMKGECNVWNTGGSYESDLTQSLFRSTGDFKVYGNIMSLLKGDNFVNTTLSSDNIGAFGGLFSEEYTDGVYYTPVRVTDASDLILPSNTVGNCYYDMFKGCTALTAAPKLPAANIADGAYDFMFYGCSLLDEVVMLGTNFYEGSVGNVMNLWLVYVANSGTVYVANSATATALDESTAGVIPYGWTTAIYSA